MITEWVKEKARTPVLVKLTPNITDIRAVARAAKRGGADGLSAINTINSITGIDLDTLDAAAECGRALVARRLLRPGGEADRAEHGAADCERSRLGLPVSGIGGIGTWRDAAEFILLGCGTVQVCTAAMHYGYPHRRGHDRRPCRTGCDEKGFATHRRFSRAEPAAASPIGKTST